MERGTVVALYFAAGDVPFYEEGPSTAGGHALEFAPTVAAGDTEQSVVDDLYHRLQDACS